MEFRPIKTFHYCVGRRESFLTTNCVGVGGCRGNCSVSFSAMLPLLYNIGTTAHRGETNELQKACVIMFSTAYANKVEASERGSGY